MLQFDSFTFFANLFIVFVVVVPIYRLVPNVVFRRVFLGLVGLYLLWLIAPRLAVFYLAFWTLTWVLQRVVGITAEKRFGTPVFATSVVLLLAPMVIWKLWTTGFVIHFNLWTDTAARALEGRWGEVDLSRDILLPLGLSFSTFRGIDLVIKTYLGVFEGLRADEVFFYGFFPPVQLIGPVIQYTEIREAVKGGTRVVEDLREGALLVLSGLAKVFVVSYPLQSSQGMFTFYKANSVGVLWLELFAFVIYFFFNFAGYSDLAIGASKMLGFDIYRNFDWPYTKTNPSAFWNSWHMSLTHFFQRNVFIPFGGMRQHTQYRAIFFTIMAIALWHNISIPLVIFGLYHAVGLIGHRWLSERRPPRPTEGWLHKLPKTAALFVFYAVSVPLLELTTSQVVPFYSAMVGAK